MMLRRLLLAVLSLALLPEATPCWAQDDGPQEVTLDTPISPAEGGAGTLTTVTASRVPSGFAFAIGQDQDEQDQDEEEEVPTLVSVDPNSGQQGQTLSVTITGQFTDFDQDTTQASFGPGISVGGGAPGEFGPVTVTSDTTVIAEIVIAQTAQEGPRTVSVRTEDEVASLPNGFTVRAGTPVLTAVNPNTGQQGQTLSVTLTGQFTHFVQGTTQASFGAGIAVGGAAAGAFGPVTVTSATSATAQLNIDASAPVGARTVTVSTGAEQPSLADGFTVQAGTPVLTAVNPNTGQQGQTLSVTLTGQFTHFVQGTTQASFGAGIAVGGGAAGAFGAVTVTSPTSATAQVVIDAASAPGTRTVTVKTGAEQVSLANAFTVNAAPPVLISVVPNSGQQGQTLSVTITGQFTHFVQGTTQASFGAGIAVGGAAAGAFGPVTVTSPTSATAQLVISAAAAAGSRAVTVKTGTEEASLATGFSVTTGLITVPKVTITAPAPLSLFSKSPITVTGTVDNASEKVLVNGVTASLSGTSFTAQSVPLREGTNILTATATDPSGNVGTASVSVTLKTMPPIIRILAPSDKAILTSSTVTVAGNVNDIVTGTVNAEQVKVTVNGVEGVVSNRSFTVADLPLVQGTNTITAVAADKLGNQSQHQIQVTFQGGIPQQKIVMVSGNNQTAVIGGKLANPLVVQVVNVNGAPIPNREVTFTVVKSDGVLTSLNQQGQQIALQTDKNGLASVTFQLGSRVGAGNNEVSATSPGFVGEVIFCETSTPGPPDKINVVSGENQNGIVGQPLPAPFVAIVFDGGGNPVSNVAVTFKVTQGGGMLAGGTDTLTVKSDSDGKAAALLKLGQQEGINNNLVTASFQGLTGAPAAFNASGVVQGAARETKVSGVVLDNANVPIPKATSKIVGTSLSATTDVQGRFSISGAPVGTITLIVDGSTSTRPETFPFLSFMLTTIAGQDNTIGMPILLPPLDTESSKIVGGDSDVALTMKGVPGVAFTVFARSVSFADGKKEGRLSLSQVHADKVPMPPANGTAPTLVWTLQPAGTRFDPPIRVQFAQYRRAGAGNGE